VKDDVCLSRAREEPHSYFPIPYKASKLTELLRECLCFEVGRQTSLVVLATFGPTVLETQLNIELAKYIFSMKGCVKQNEEKQFQVSNVLSPPDWGVKETTQWFQLNSKIPKNRIPQVVCSDLLALSQLEFLQLMKGCSPATVTESILNTHGLLWEEVRLLRAEDKINKLAKQKRSFSTKDTHWRLEDDLEPDQVMNAALGSSQKQFEAGLNRGFEVNRSRFEKRTSEMMKLEWAGKVAAADRAEAKLYPILK